MGIDIAKKRAYNLVNQLSKRFFAIFHDNRKIKAWFVLKFLQISLRD